LTDFINYLLDQGAAYLYQLYDAYAPNDGPSLSEIESFKSGNHAGSDAISFSLHGYPVVYSTRLLDFSPKPYLVLASLFARGSSDVGYYRSVADKYLSAREWLVNNPKDYPVLDFHTFESYSGQFPSNLMNRSVCYKASLDEISNITWGAALDPTWYNGRNGGSNWDWNNWYNKIVRPSFQWTYIGPDPHFTSLCIDNYEPSLYMRTVQAYIQGLEQGSINKNCTFITIMATPSVHTVEDGKHTLTRMVSYLNYMGEYFTTVIKIVEEVLNALYTAGKVAYISAVYAGSVAFSLAIKHISLLASVASSTLAQY
jgi:hypothetical protein